MPQNWALFYFQILCVWLKARWHSEGWNWRDVTGGREGGEGELPLHTLPLPGHLYGEGSAVSAAGQGKAAEHVCVVKWNSCVSVSVITSPCVSQSLPPCVSALLYVSSMCVCITLCLHHPVSASLCVSITMQVGNTMHVYVSDQASPCMSTSLLASPCMSVSLCHCHHACLYHCVSVSITTHVCITVSVSITMHVCIAMCQHHHACQCRHHRACLYHHVSASPCMSVSLCVSITMHVCITVYVGISMCILCMPCWASGSDLSFEPMRICSALVLLICFEDAWSAIQCLC